MLESEGIVFIRLKLSPVTLWEPTHFIPKYPRLASRLDLFIAVEAGSDASSSERMKLLRPVPRSHGAETVPADFAPRK